MKSAVALLVCLAAALLAAPARAQNSRVAYARYSVRGPLTGFELDGGRAGATEVILELAAGETLEQELPVPVLGEPQPGHPGPGVSADSLPAGAEVRFLGWDGPRAMRMAEGWRRLPRGLTARSRPPIDAADGRRRGGTGDAFTLQWLAVLGLLGVGLRKRPAAAVAVGLAAAGVLFLRGAPAAPDGSLSVLEGDAAGTTWIEVVGTWGHTRLDGAVAGERVLRVETSPAEAWLRIEVDLRRGGRGVHLRADATLVRVLEVDLPGGPYPKGIDPTYLATARWPASPTTPSRAFGLVQPGPEIQSGWYRDAGGDWGRWRGNADPGDAPGWLASGLPQGVDVVLFAGRDGHFLRQTTTAEPPNWFFD